MCSHTSHDKFRSYRFHEDFRKHHDFVPDTSIDCSPAPELLALKTTIESDVTLLSTLLSLCRNLYSSDRRDAMYAIRELINWRSKLGPIHVDYTMNPTELFWRTITHVPEEDGVVYHYDRNGAWGSFSLEEWQ
jgi:hypothetical protein